MQKTILLSSTIRTSENIVSRNLQGELILLNLKTNLYCGLDHVGTKIWQLINKHKILNEVLNELMKEYDVSEAKCTEDLLNFLSMLKEKELIEI